MPNTDYDVSSPPPAHAFARAPIAPEARRGDSRRPANRVKRSKNSPNRGESRMPIQLALFPEVVELTRVRPEKNEKRFYRLEIRPDLFGRTMLIRRWGSIGTTGRQSFDTHPDVGTALNALVELAVSKRRRGYREQLPA